MGFGGLGIGATLAISLLLLFPRIGSAHNGVLGTVQFRGKSHIDKISGVFVDGQYLGFVEELQGKQQVLLLPGKHQIEIRHAGFIPVTRTVMIEPGKKFTIYYSMFKDQRAQFPKAAAARIQLKVKPQRAAVFVDGAYMGTPREFGGGHRMLVAPGKHQLRIALAGYQDFTTSIELAPDQKMTIRTNLMRGTDAGPTLGSD